MRGIDGLAYLAPVWIMFLFNYLTPRRVYDLANFRYKAVFHQIGSPSIVRFHKNGGASAD